MNRAPIPIRAIGCGRPIRPNEPFGNPNHSVLNNMSRQQRPVVIAIGALVLAWLLAWSGYVISGHSKMTAEKVRQYQRSLDLAHLSAADRLKGLKSLAGKLNALATEERHQWPLE